MYIVRKSRSPIRGQSCPIQIKEDRQTPRTVLTRGKQESQRMIGTHRSPTIRERIAIKENETCEGGGMKFPEEDTSHLRIQYSALT